jgi:hypothetical protein
VLGGKFPPFLGGPSAESLYGLTGLSTSPFLTGGLNTQSITGFSGMGRRVTNPQFKNPTNWDPKANYAWLNRRHALNHYNFGFPDATITDAAFGTIRQTYPARQIQFGLKLTY